MPLEAGPWLAHIWPGGRAPEGPAIALLFAPAILGSKFCFICRTAAGRCRLRAHVVCVCVRNTGRSHISRVHALMDGISGFRGRFALDYTLCERAFPAPSVTTFFATFIFRQLADFADLGAKPPPSPTGATPAPVVAPP